MHDTGQEVGIDAKELCLISRLGTAFASILPTVANFISWRPGGGDSRREPCGCERVSSSNGKQTTAGCSAVASFTAKCWESLKTLFKPRGSSVGELVVQLIDIVSEPVFVLRVGLINQRPEQIGAVVDVILSKIFGFFHVIAVQNKAAVQLTV